LQGDVKVAVTVPADENRALTHWGLAKDYFSTVMTLHRAFNPLATLGMVREGEAVLGVMPWPVDGDASPWWRFLMMADSAAAPIRIVARLPMGSRDGQALNSEDQTLVIGRLHADSTGDDRSFIALSLGHSISR